MNNSYFVSGGTLDLSGNLLECHICKRKILVEIALFGVSHNASVTATCATCLVIDKEFQAKHPDAVEKIEEWRNG